VELSSAGKKRQRELVMSALRLHLFRTSQVKAEATLGSVFEGEFSKLVGDGVSDQVLIGREGDVHVSNILIGVGSGVNLPNHCDIWGAALMLEANVDGVSSGVVEQMADVESLLRADALERRLGEAVEDETGEQASLDVDVVERAQSEDGAGVVQDLFRDRGVAIGGSVGECAREPGGGGIAGVALAAMGIQGSLAISGGEAAEMIEPFRDVVVSLHFKNLG
jgi:hypothetical protein